MKKELGFLSVFSIGVGGMVGGGIFAVLGLATELSHGLTPIAFLIAGIVALLTSYSYAKLSVKYPSRGGTVEFLTKAFGNGKFTGGINILLYLSYVIMISLYAYAFGSYGAVLFGSHYTFWKHVLISSAIIGFTAINIAGSKAVGESEKYIVALKISILLLFIAVGLFGIHKANFENVVSPMKLIAGGMIIFLAYEGFELIANTAEDVKDVKILPKAYYASVIFVIGLYIAISFVAIGNLPVPQIVKARDYALAEAAKPMLGSFGFILISIAALLSTSSAINATLYSSARISYIIAKDGDLPKFFEWKVWRKPIEGLLITTVLTLLVANLFDLSSISIIGSSGFLLIFGLVNLANYKLSNKTKSNKWISLSGAILSFVAFGILIWQVVGVDLFGISIFLLMISSSFAIEILYRHFTNRKISRTFSKKTII